MGLRVTRGLSCGIILQMICVGRQHKTVILHVDDEVYEWNGEAFYDGSELKTAPIEGKEVYVEINGKKEASGPSVCIKGEDTDTLYYEMPWGSPGHYLVMVKKRQ